jgi:hypothetical protein
MLQLMFVSCLKQLIAVLPVSSSIAVFQTLPIAAAASRVVQLGALG